MQIGVETSKAVDQRRVFVVDDDEIIRAALQFMLHDEIETHELANPEEAYIKGVGWLHRTWFCSASVREGTRCRPDPGDCSKIPRRAHPGHLR